MVRTTLLAAGSGTSTSYNALNVTLAMGTNAGGAGSLLSGTKTVAA